MIKCLLPDKIKEFRQALKDKTLDLNKLFDANTTTEQRTKVFEPYAGENALAITQLFEEKMILKNRLAGMKNAINKLGETGKYDPSAKLAAQDALSEYRHLQQERILSPKEHETFLNTLANKLLKTEVTKAESAQAFDLSSKADEAFKNFDPVTEKWSSPQAAADYASNKVIYTKYLNNLRNGDLSIKGMLKEYSAEIKQLWKEDKPKAVAKIIGESVYNLNKNLINIVASWDNSWMGRQGAILFTKSPVRWWRIAKAGMSDFYQVLKGSNPEDVVAGQVFSHPDFINGNFDTAKITFGLEEEVPASFTERIYGLGRIFKASDVSFVNSAMRAKMELFDMYKQVYKGKNIPLDAPLLRDMGTQINSISARGKLGATGGSKTVNLVMWAPRMLKADWDIITGHTFGVGLETNVARMQSAKTLFQVMAYTAATAAIAEAMGATVEKDPRSSDFLQIKVGNTRIRIPFARGIPQIATLIARVATQETKSTSTGLITELNSGKYGSKTVFDVGIDFLANKTTPVAGAVIDWAKGRNFQGEKPTVANTALGFMPISVQNFLQLKDQDSTAAVGAFIDLFGIGSTTYKPPKAKPSSFK